MDNPSMTWVPELEMEVPGNHLKHQQTRPYYNKDLVDSFSSKSFKRCPNVVTSNQSTHISTINSDIDKQQDHKASNITKTFAPSQAPSPNTFTISFKNPTKTCHDAVMPDEETSLNEFLQSIDSTTRFQRTRRNERQSQEHVLAERKRREKLAERFVSLSTLLPGIKKMDKALVLEDARRYIIQLQTRVKELEETSLKGKDIIQESGVCIGTSKLCGGQEDVASSSDDTNYLPSTSTFIPEIKARISGSKMLVRIYCMESSPTILLKTVAEMDRHHVTIDCCSVIPFGTDHLITITAQMSDEMVVTAKYLVKCLMSSLRDFH
ncbi:transcription factor bHLH18-like [Bidens hawaiensis]|uniref:transcription factor bHLH18-like n=1 Tax=Bidens hawaiensis TaxID=980011 RepID=UPI00404A8A5A